ncbi:MAG: hypothetical protein KDC80_02090 [Saprospiraceae bacterium]|nr:hypothetical protein [Saprospiraceae bacterium]
MKKIKHLISKRLPFCLCLLLFAHCQQDEPIQPIVDIHPDFQSIVDLFVLEAAGRGKEIEIDNLILQYAGALDQNICGECNSLASLDRVQKEIRVNADPCWQHERELEALIFHELGHCILQRPHLSDTLPNGDPKSMMIEGDITIYAPCRYVVDDPAECNNLHKRDYYIDELFNPNTPVPNWAKDQ